MKKPFDFEKEFKLYRKVLRKKKGSKKSLRQELSNSKISIKVFEHLTYPMETIAITLMTGTMVSYNGDLGKIEAVGTILFAAVYLTSIYTKELMKESFYEEIYRILYKE